MKDPTWEFMALGSERTVSRTGGILNWVSPYFSHNTTGQSKSMVKSDSREKFQPDPVNRILKWPASLELISGWQICGRTFVPTWALPMLHLPLILPLQDYIKLSWVPKVLHWSPCLITFSHDYSKAFWLRLTLIVQAWIVKIIRGCL
jgi:hypothetical protein